MMKKLTTKRVQSRLALAAFVAVICVTVATTTIGVAGYTSNHGGPDSGHRARHSRRTSLRDLVGGGPVDISGEIDHDFIPTSSVQQSGRHQDPTQHTQDDDSHRRGRSDLGRLGVLAQVEATSAAETAQDSLTTLADPAAAGTFLPIASARADISTVAVARPTIAPTATQVGSARAAVGKGAVARPTIAPAPTVTPTSTPATIAAEDESSAATAAQFKLDIVQWVKSTTGERVAVVRDARGMLWYVWGTDVPLIEQGLSPQYPPQAVNTQGRSRKS